MTLLRLNIEMVKKFNSPRKLYGPLLGCIFALPGRTLPGYSKIGSMKSVAFAVVKILYKLLFMQNL